MPKGKTGLGIPDVIERLFAGREFVTSGQVATAAGVTRQAAHYHLRALEEQGLLTRIGAGRGSRYRRATLRTATYPLDGLEEHVVWGEEFLALKQLDLPIFDNSRIKPILDFTFTEMLNNAIDHSGGSRATVSWFLDPERLSFEVADDGIGVFRKVRESRGLESEFEAIGEISKGKQTTAPERHSGLGIFFSSRMVDTFVLSSGRLTWTVDSRRADQAVGWLDRDRVGTLVRCQVSSDTEIVPLDVFDRYSDPETYGFSKSTVRVALFREGEFVSRSEAKRVGAHLEAFDVVEVDFSGVQQVGQGFVDELFRVWQRDHPHTRLVPVNANPAILAMIGKTVPDVRNPTSGA